LCSYEGEKEKRARFPQAKIEKEKQSRLADYGKKAGNPRGAGIQWGKEKGSAVRCKEGGKIQLAPYIRRGKGGGKELQRALQEKGRKKIKGGRNNGFSITIVISATQKGKEKVRVWEVGAKGKGGRPETGEESGLFQN